MRTARQVPINFFAMPGRRVREHFSSYAKEAYVDEVRLRVHTVCTQCAGSQSAAPARALGSLRAWLSVGLAPGATRAPLSSPVPWARLVCAVAPRQPRCPLPPRRLT